MFFGLCNSPASFQKMMDNIVVTEIDGGWLIVYMDDLLICANTIQKLQEKTRSILSQLWKHDLYIKPEKCEWEVEEVEMLGTIIKYGEAKMSKKDQSRCQLAIPTTVHQTEDSLDLLTFTEDSFASSPRSPDPSMTSQRKTPSLIGTPNAK
ncbi:unnamed protein product [Cyclocybe aegerita]|uniref:Reverse transcriptase domain-containing protein n=1 Tax=Cyclocybe aegerita TaxID=1973307 RepID=A0A8S0W7L1_CYCAE|nr:unnamed protein product [Cyclocybe aegerita]